ncbi:MAG: FeoA family protein [Tepidimonas sp.]|uniref:FeoA family protein n=1 Tax=Tepidimonas sp. TaxID=2002775 RepID=UPI004054E827
MDTPLDQLPRYRRATITALRSHGPDDAVAHRLHVLGFYPGETVEVLAHSPFGGDPIVVRVGDTRFALRRAEAARVRVAQDQEESAHG